LFSDRARRIRPDFIVDQNNTVMVEEICTRLDGMPLAIELAAARVRALSLQQIVDSLHDRFRLLTGGARTAVRRQQTLRASVDWSHALLTEPEQVLFRRLAAFAGGFDLEAAQAVGASSNVESYQLLDQLSLLVDKSLVVADDTATGMRYRLLETVRQYAQEKLGESSEADEARTRHRDYYIATASHLESMAEPGDEQLQRWAQVEIENLRAAYTWSRENSDPETALRLVSALHRFWLRSGRFREALAAFDGMLTTGHSSIAPEVWVRGVADHCALAVWGAVPTDLDRAQEAVAIARQLDDPKLLTHVLMGCGMLAVYNAEVSQPYLVEAIDLARTREDWWGLSQMLCYQAAVAVYAGDFVAAQAAGAEGGRIADELGDRFTSWGCKVWLGAALGLSGDFHGATEVLRVLVDEAEETEDLALKTFSQTTYANLHAFKGDAVAAGSLARSAVAASEAMGGLYGDSVYATMAIAALAEGDIAAARQATEECRRRTVPEREVFIRTFNPVAEAALAAGDLSAARKWADDVVAMAPGGHQAVALSVRAWVAAAQNEPDQAERDAHDALTVAERTRTHLRVPETLECLAYLASNGGNHSHAARLLGAAQGIRQRVCQDRYPMYQADYEATLLKVQEVLGQSDFEAAWAESAALSTEQAIAYAQRGRGERKRPTIGWGALTPMELDVVRLVAEGLGNNDIGTRLFISPRTVQSHLTHVYAKLGLTSRVQLAKEAGRHT
jgi:DNA-binding CsgD family transcriptional regulator